MTYAGNSSRKKEVEVFLRILNIVLVYGVPLNIKYRSPVFIVQTSNQGGF